MALLVGSVQQSWFQVTVDSVSGDQPIQVFARTQGLIPQSARVLQAKMLFDPILAAADTHVHLASVAARCSPSRGTLLQKCDIYPVSRQVQRGRQASISTSDHADIALELFGERFGLERPSSGCSVVGGGMIGRSIEHVVTVA